MAQGLGGEVDNTGAREYGRTPVTVSKPGTLFADVPAGAERVDVARRRLLRRPRGLHRHRVHRRTPGRGLRERRPKPVRRPVPPRGDALRARPAGPGALPLGSPAAGPTWTMVNVVEEQVEPIREQVGDRGAICGLSGGVDSAVAAALVQKAIGYQLTCVYVDHGLMRKGETEQVEKDFVAATGVELKVVDAEERFLDALAGVSDPEEKRKIIGREFIRVFEEAQAEILADAGPATTATRSRSSSRARSTRTSSSPAAAPAPPTSSPTTTSAASPTTSSSSSSSRCASCSRTRSGWSARSSACPTRSSSASRSRAPASASASSARSPGTASTSSARPTPSPARS